MAGRDGFTQTPDGLGFTQQTAEGLGFMQTPSHLPRGSLPVGGIHTGKRTHSLFTRLSNMVSANPAMKAMKIESGASSLKGSDNMEVDSYVVDIGEVQAVYEAIESYKQHVEAGLEVIEKKRDREITKGHTLKLIYPKEPPFKWDVEWQETKVKGQKIIDDTDWVLEMKQPEREMQVLATGVSDFGCKSIDDVGRLGDQLFTVVREAKKFGVCAPAFRLLTAMKENYEALTSKVDAVVQDMEPVSVPEEKLARAEQMLMGYTNATDLANDLQATHVLAGP
ncbi:unnamed protein product [Vitrella brassicaformis CCMP3155]|uniref:Uncharacterized protein n=1 Tax=Vitrella brassicaformis (strain CCMP3155) TaxID=1169540 RepID=A0A0G4GWF0_VITBC|nr:unnamed protein product [Vitrella brassicaformis CCMP3155]|eukprot:CEM35306.1 unnamed protein product [Vitrella brassicaformis CCMP3155]